MRYHPTLATMDSKVQALLHVSWNGGRVALAKEFFVAGFIRLFLHQHPTISYCSLSRMQPKRGVVLAVFVRVAVYIPESDKLHEEPSVCWQATVGVAECGGPEALVWQTTWPYQFLCHSPPSTSDSDHAICRPHPAHIKQANQDIHMAGDRVWRGPQHH